MLTWSEKDHVFCPAIGLEGQILQINGDRAQVWWSDDDVSWEPLGVLEPVAQAVTDWAKCPRCGTARWHHLGDFKHVPTGRTVDVAVLDEVPPVALWRTLDDPAEVVEITCHYERGQERKRLVERECRDCGHRWHEDTGKTDAIRAEQP